MARAIRGHSNSEGRRGRSGNNEGGRGKSGNSEGDRGRSGGGLASDDGAGVAVDGDIAPVTLTET